MPRRIAIIQGNPDPRGKRFTHALADAYTKGAEAAGHEVRLIDVAKLDFPMVRSKDDIEKAAAPAAISALGRLNGAGVKANPLSVPSVSVLPNWCIILV